GVTASTNQPGARQYSSATTYLYSSHFLFGGNGYGEASVGLLNDIWQWDGSNWTWIGGGKDADCWGTYGTIGVADPSNEPGCRASATLVGTSNGLHIMGGVGFDALGSPGYMT